MKIPGILRSLKFTFIAIFCCVSCAAFAQNPFVGTWKVDLAKSHLTGDTMTFSPETNGAVRFSADGHSYSFKLDGSTSTNWVGEPEQWTKVDEHTWKVVSLKGSTVLGTGTLALSADGKTLTDTSTGTKPNGDPVNGSATYTRTAPGKGFFGTWRSTRVSNSSPNTAQIEANGNNGIIWNIPEMKASVNLKFDGKYVAPIGPRIPSGVMLSATRTGPRSLTLREKFNGKLAWTGHLTVSPSGKTMTEIGRPVGSAHATRRVYEKM